jgi:hypothetical protein
MSRIAIVALVLAAASVASAVRAQTSPPVNLMPVDGATDVPLEVDLSWTWEPPVGCPEGIGITVFTVFLGTDPENLSAVSPCCNEGWPQPVGPLDPAVTYYWQVRVVDEFHDCPFSHQAYSVIQSFTTVAPIGVETSTWSRIKALYR